MIRSLSVIARFVVLLVLAIPAPSSARQFDAIYVIGDSLSDQGNLFGATTLIPGAPQLPDANHYFDGRVSNGPVYTDLLAQALELPLGPSLLGGNNFAYGGARTAYNVVDSVFPPGLFPWSLNAEVAEFINRGVHDPRALYIVFSGANDIADILVLGLDPATVIPNAVAGILGAVQAFKNAGATIVLVANIPDLGLTPAFRPLGPPATNPASFFSRQFNQALQVALNGFSGLHIIQFQTDELFNSAVSNPGEFGLTNVTADCYTGFVSPIPAGIVRPECNPDQWLFWDRVHPTAAVHAILAEAILRCFGGHPSITGRGAETVAPCRPEPRAPIE